MENGIHLDKSKMPFIAWMWEWLEVYSKPKVRKSTHSSYYHIIKNHIEPEFPKVLLRDITCDMLQKFYNGKLISGRKDGTEGGISLSYAHTMIAIISSALKRAVLNGMIHTNEASKVVLSKKTKKEIDVLTLDEQRKLEHTLFNSTNPLAFIFLLKLYSGMRIGELLALKLADVNLDEKEIYVRSTRRPRQIPGASKNEVVEGEPKTAKSRRDIPLTDMIIQQLNKYLEYRHYKSETLKYENKKEANNYLFVTYLGTIPSYPGIRTLFVRILKEANITRRVNMHVLRHTFATRCLESGMDVKTLADILGHDNPLTTLNVYAHSTNEHKHKSMSNLKSLYKEDNEIE